MNAKFKALYQKVKQYSPDYVTGINLNLLPGVGVGVAWRTKKEPEVKAGLLSELLKIRNVIKEHLMLIDIVYAENFYDEDYESRYDNFIPCIADSSDFRIHISEPIIYELIFNAFNALEKQTYESKYYLTYVINSSDSTNQLAGIIQLYEYVKLIRHIMSSDEDGEPYYENLQKYAWEDEHLLEPEQLDIFYNVLIDTLIMVDKEINEASL